MTSRVFQNCNRLVIKVGSSLVTNDGKGLDLSAVQRWAAEIAALRSSGKEVILVSSGAIAEGMKRLGWQQRPHLINELQAAAAVGQMGLVQAYEAAFEKFFLLTAQVLLTHEDLADRTRYLNARTTLRTLLALQVVPIINENDTITTDEIKVGDNDTLGALVTNLVDADLLILLTDQQGLYTADPRKDPGATLIHQEVAGKPELEAIAGGAGTAIGRGGMLTKVLAAKRAARSGAGTIIACGREPQILQRLMQGERIGSYLSAPYRPVTARKQWLADHVQLAGRLYLDEGAAQALTQKGRSLLPVGVVRVEGNFLRGEVVGCYAPNGMEIARGLINYSTADAMKIAHHASHEIVALLGYCEEKEMIHRDNLIVL